MSDDEIGEPQEQFRRLHARLATPGQAQEREPDPEPDSRDTRAA